jgi:PsbN protein
LLFFTFYQTANIYMETATILSIFISGLLLGITGYSVYTAFGPVSKELRDPFEEHED